MKVPILFGNVAIAKHRCWHAYDAWRRIDWIINVVIKTFALNKNGDDLSIAYNIIKPRSSASWKCNGPRFIFTRPYRRLIRLRENSFVLSQIFAYPVIIVKGKAYLGGKGISNSGGNLVDFLAKNDISKNAVLIEIKTPTTQLLNGQYRGNAYSVSTDLSGAVVQVANYKNSLQNEFHNLVDSKDDLDAFEPRCLVIAGNYSKEIGRSSTKKKSLDLFRSHLKEIEIITYDELFGKVQFLINLLEGESYDYVPSKEDAFDVPF